MTFAQRDRSASFFDDDDLVPTLVMQETASGLQPIAIERRREPPSNVFLSKPLASDPPPPWSKLANPRNARTRQLRVRVRKRPRNDHAVLVHVAVALAAAILFGLAYDVRTRRQVAADAACAATAATHYVFKKVRSIASEARSSVRPTPPAAVAP